MGTFFDGPCVLSRFDPDEPYTADPVHDDARGEVRFGANPFLLLEALAGTCHCEVVGRDVVRDADVTWVRLVIDTASAADRSGQQLRFPVVGSRLLSGRVVVRRRLPHPSMGFTWPDRRRWWIRKADEPLFGFRQKRYMTEFWAFGAPRP